MMVELRSGFQNDSWMSWKVIPCRIEDRSGWSDEIDQSVFLIKWPEQYYQTLISPLHQIRAPVRVRSNLDMQWLVVCWHSDWQKLEHPCYGGNKMINGPNKLLCCNVRVVWNLYLGMSNKHPDESDIRRVNSEKFQNFHFWGTPNNHREKPDIR